MITVWPDWNCIIALEAECDYSPAVRQIRDWYKQGKVALSIAKASRLENAPGKRVYDTDAWGEKLRNIGLEGIEFREARPRPFLDEEGIPHFFIFCRTASLAYSYGYSPKLVTVFLDEEEPETALEKRESYVSLIQAINLGEATVIFLRDICHRRKRLISLLLPTN